MQKGRSETLSNFGPSLARQAGIEPTTPWFVARYSIQLSYWRTAVQQRERTIAQKIILCLDRLSQNEQI